MKYLIRSVKYFLALCVLYVLLIALAYLTSGSAVHPADAFAALVRNTRGQVMIAAVILLSALYPRFGFIRREESGTIPNHREQIINAFASEGFRLTGEDDNGMVFRGDTFIKRLLLLFEDEIRVTQEGDRIVMEGIRRGVARVYYRLQTYIDRTPNNDE